MITPHKVDKRKSSRFKFWNNVWEVISKVHFPFLRRAKIFLTHHGYKGEVLMWWFKVWCHIRTYIKDSQRIFLGCWIKIATISAKVYGHHIMTKFQQNFLKGRGVSQIRKLNSISFPGVFNQFFRTLLVLPKSQNYRVSYHLMPKNWIFIRNFKVLKIKTSKYKQKIILIGFKVSCQEKSKKIEIIPGGSMSFQECWPPWDSERVWKTF